MIYALSDDTLLEIFYFYQMDATHRVPQLWRWHILVHVCRRWRYVVYASPRRLCLQIFCKPTAPVRASLNVWPPLPITIRYSPTHEGQRGEDNIIAALENRDRVSEISFAELTSSVLEQFSPAMEASFPILRFLRLESFDESVTDLPDAQSFTLDGIAFPAIPKFLLSATHLLGLWLWRIPNTGYISPETGQLPARVDQSQNPLHRIPVSKLSPRSTESTSTRTRYPPCSHPAFLQRC